MLVPLSPDEFSLEPCSNSSLRHLASAANTRYLTTFVLVVSGSIKVAIRLTTIFVSSPCGIVGGGRRRTEIIGVRTRRTSSVSMIWPIVSVSLRLASSRRSGARFGAKLRRSCRRSVMQPRAGKSEGVRSCCAFQGVKNVIYKGQYLPSIEEFVAHGYARERYADFMRSWEETIDAHGHL